MKDLTIKITDTNRARLTEVYQQLEADLMLELSEVRNVLAELTGDTKYLTNGMDGYNKAWTWIQKTRFVIKQMDKPLSTTEIAGEIIKKYEPEKRDERKQVVSAISSIISTNQSPEPGQFVKVDGERSGEYKYGLFEWDTEAKDEEPNSSKTVTFEANDDLPF